MSTITQSLIYYTIPNFNASPFGENGTWLQKWRFTAHHPIPSSQAWWNLTPTKSVINEQYGWSNCSSIHWCRKETTLFGKRFSSTIFQFEVEFPLSSQTNSNIACPILNLFQIRRGSSKTSPFGSPRVPSIMTSFRKVYSHTRRQPSFPITIYRPLPYIPHVWWKFWNKN